MKDKMKYLPADVDIICFNSNDVIVTSGGGEFTDGTYEPDGWV